MSKNPKTNLAEIIAKEIANGHNQHRMMIVEGPTGSGKSNFTVDLAYEVSKQFAKILGGEPDNYFKIDNIAMISTSELVRVIRSIKKHNIYIMDDIAGEAFSSRNWNSGGNKAFGYILQTFRTFNNFLIMSAPDKEFIDKIGRNVVHFKAVMKMNLELMDYGYSTGSVSRVEKMYNKDNGGHMYPFLTRDREIFTSMRVPRAPEHLMKEYEERRERIQAEVQEKKIVEMEEFFKKLEESLLPEGEKPKKISKGERAYYIKRDWKAGVYGDRGLRDICRDEGVNYNTVRSIKTEC